jgi:hypothetical protein
MTATATKAPEITPEHRAQAKRAVIASSVASALEIERRPDAKAPGAGEIWRRVPKFVLGFLAASVIATISFSQVGPVAGKPVIALANDLQTLFFIAAFVSIRLEFRAAGPQDISPATGRRVRGRHRVQSRCRACDFQRPVRELQTQLID